MSEDHTILRSQDPLRNRDRLYTMSKNKGLLGTTVVVVRNARYGQNGKQRIYIFDNDKNADNFIYHKTLEKLKRDYKEIGYS